MNVVLVGASSNKLEHLGEVERVSAANRDVTSDEDKHGRIVKTHLYIHGQTLHIVVHLADFLLDGKCGQKIID